MLDEARATGEVNRAVVRGLLNNRLDDPRAFGRTIRARIA